MSWEVVAAALQAHGERASALDLGEAFTTTGRFYEAFGDVAARQIVRPSYLVVHSDAGALVPSIVARAEGRVRGAIFVDALPPHPGPSWFDTAPAALADRVRRRARLGLAPPWPGWLPSGALPRLLPDTAMREHLITGARAVPLTYLEETAPHCPALPLIPCGYLRLSEGYEPEAERARARALGWPLERIGGHHLTALADPDLVDAAIARLAGRMEGAGS